MSLSKTIDVFCDACGNWVGNGCKTNREARAEAKKQGWACVRGAGELTDLCPTCSEENKKSQTKQK